MSLRKILNIGGFEDSGRWKMAPFVAPAIADPESALFAQTYSRPPLYLCVVWPCLWSNMIAYEWSHVLLDAVATIRHLEVGYETETGLLGARQSWKGSRRSWIIPRRKRNHSWEFLSHVDLIGTSNLALSVDGTRPRLPGSSWIIQVVPIAAHTLLAGVTLTDCGLDRQCNKSNAVLRKDACHQSVLEKSSTHVHEIYPIPA